VIRKCHNKNKFRPDRKKLLDEVGFTWTADNPKFIAEDKLWHQQCEQLVEFKQKHGHCVVTRRNKEDKSLGQWVSHQQNLHNNNKLRQDRKEFLDEIGFDWKADGARNLDQKNRTKLSWNKQYLKLVHFERKTGHYVVPTKCEQDKAFGYWVSAQRRIHASNKMRINQKELLDEIGFAWKAPAALAHQTAQAPQGHVVRDKFECPSPNSDELPSYSESGSDSDSEEHASPPAVATNHMSNYERLRAENIERNNARMFDLGIMTPEVQAEQNAKAWMISGASTPSPNKRRKTRSATKIPTPATRKSPRVQDRLN
jgi:hypothetical protein